jgi:murein DD-endopeptidase MepM/ murein hydrolase activator NlpD
MFPFNKSRTLSTSVLLICCLFVSFLLFAACTASRNAEGTRARLLQKGRIKDETTPIYALPYEKGSSHLLVQGYYSSFSHKNRAALDFAMKEGTKILAARNGVVIRMEEQNNKGGGNRKYRQYANLIVVAHDDGTRAGYWHLKQNGVFVNVGDTVKQGQVIGLSGKTGYALFPHLHFLVWTNNNRGWQQVPTRFMTSKGPKYLRPLRWWRNK